MHFQQRRGSRFGSGSVSSIFNWLIDLHLIRLLITSASPLIVQSTLQFILRPARWLSQASKSACTFDTHYLCGVGHRHPPGGKFCIVYFGLSVCSIDDLAGILKILISSVLHYCCLCRKLMNGLLSMDSFVRKMRRRNIEASIKGQEALLALESVIQLLIS